MRNTHFFKRAFTFAGCLALMCAMVVQFHNTAGATAFVKADNTAGAHFTINTTDVTATAPNPDVAINNNWTHFNTAGANAVANPNFVFRDPAARDVGAYATNFTMTNGTTSSGGLAATNAGFNTGQNVANYNILTSGAGRGAPNNVNTNFTMNGANATMAVNSGFNNNAAGFDNTAGFNFTGVGSPGATFNNNC